MEEILFVENSVTWIPFLNITELRYGRHTKDACPIRRLNSLREFFDVVLREEFHTRIDYEYPPFFLPLPFPPSFL